MSRDEARRVGAAIGCDFFIIGKAEALTRSTRENESHEEAYAGVMIVDSSPKFHRSRTTSCTRTLSFASRSTTS